MRLYVFIRAVSLRFTDRRGRKTKAKFKNDNYSRVFQ